MSSGPLDDLIHHLSRLPGVGHRTATRLGFFLLKSKPQYRQQLIQALENLSSIYLCSDCATFTTVDPCTICRSPLRHRKKLCVVEKPSDIYQIEKLNLHNGLYFVLHGLLSPMEGIGPMDLKIPQLLERIHRDEPEEVILALSPTVEGEATAQFLARDLRCRVTKLASGLPIGADLEFADEITLGKAFEARTQVR